MQWTDDSTADLRKWSKEVETSVLQATTTGDRGLSRCEGRCTVLDPTPRTFSLPIPRNSRDGEQVILSSFLGRAVQNWWKQLRRFQSLLHNVRKGSDSVSATMYRQQT